MLCKLSLGLYDVSSQADITQEATREVDRQDDTQWEQTHYSHEKDDVTLKCQVGNCINATLTTELFISVEQRKAKWKKKTLTK